jgi:hypothetical protein
VGEHDVLRSKIRCQNQIQLHVFKQNTNMKTNLTTGNPLTLVSLNAVYHTGRRRYLSLKTSFTISLYGWERRYGSRRFVSMCACPRKNGLNAPTWYHRTNISGSGSPKKPPTSASNDSVSFLQNTKRRRITHTQRNSSQQYYSPKPSCSQQPYVPTSRGYLPSTSRRNVGNRRRRNG